MSQSKVKEKVIEFEKKEKIEQTKAYTEKIINSALEELERCKEKLEKRKKITSSDKNKLPIKKSLNDISKECEETLENLKWCKENKINVNKELEKILEEIKTNIEQIKEENFEKKHGSKRGTVFNLKECKIVIEELKKMKKELNEFYESVNSKEEFKKFEAFAEKSQASVKIYDEKCSKTLRALKNLDDSYAQYDKETGYKIFSMKIRLLNYNEEFKRSKRKREESLKSKEKKEKMDNEYERVIQAKQARKEKPVKENDIKKEDNNLSSIYKKLGSELLSFGKNILSLIPRDNYDIFE